MFSLSKTWRPPFLPHKTCSCPARIDRAFRLVLFLPIACIDRLPNTRATKHFISVHCRDPPTSFDRTAAAVHAQLLNTRPMASWAPQSPDLSSYHSADTEPVHPQHQGYRGSVSQPVPQAAPPLLSSPSLHSNPSPYSTYAPYSARRENMQDADYIPDAPFLAPQMPDLGNGSTGGSMLPPNIDSIIIKNHFPVARIKRIMQADDDVGKVAQVTPVVVCKLY